MNFSNTVKEEIIGKPIKDKCCKKAFLAGLMRGNGKLFSRGEYLGLDFYVYGENTAILAANFLSSVYGYEIREMSTTYRKDKKEKFVISIFGDKAAEILKDLNILTVDGEDTAVNLNIFSGVCEKECCFRAFFKGLFISVGNITVPDEESSLNTGYHLELVFSHYAPALLASEKLSDFGVFTKITRRKDNFIVYIKSAEEIKNFIAFVGAPVSVLKLTERMINREVSNNSNMQANCDLGNVNRQIEATEKHLAAIKKLKSSGEFDKLKPELKSTAINRELYSDDTLSELAERMNITKSCLNHRLRKITEFANKDQG